jgi:hypothetical protein
MNLRCKKSWIDKSTGIIRIREGVLYQVLNKHTKPNGERYWLFDLSPFGSGHFDIGEYFETPEEVRDKKLNELLNGKDYTT